MALEAFGVASSAAGLVSLGLAVCQSLIQYYDSWKDARSDVARMLASVEELGKTFQLLQNTFRDRNLEAGIVARVDKALVLCRAGLEALQKRLEKINLVPKDHGIREKLNATIQRSTYPFKESTLVKLREIVNELRDDLGLALNTLQIDTSAKSLQKLNMITERLAPMSTSIEALGLKADDTIVGVDSLKGISAKVSATVKLMESRQNDEYMLEFYRWLSPLGETCVAKQHAMFGLDNRQEGMWKWLLETEQFREWLAGTKGTLWCPGQPGVGKTVLTSSIVDYLRRDFRTDDIGMAYIYCDYNDDRQTAVNLIAGVLHQLTLKNELITDTLMRLHKEHKLKGTRLSISEYISLLRKAIERFSRVLIVIDALDECSQRERDRVRETFLAEVKALRPKAQLLVTSRDIPDIALEFEDAARLYIRASEVAMANYIAARIDTSRNLKRHIRRTSTLRDEIIQTITRKAEGMFLLVRMHVDSLATKSVLGDVKSVLNNLPAGLEELDSAYDKVILRILNQDTDDARMAKKVLTWLFYAMRPLTLLEVQHAMAIRLGATEIHEDFLPDEDIIVSVCAGIVTVESESMTVAFVHFTTKEYFRRRLARGGVEPFLLPQAYLAQDCLTYLLFDEFQNGPPVSQKQEEFQLNKYPFLNYAAKNWGNHWRGEIEPAIENLGLKFLREKSAMTLSVQIVSMSNGIPGFGFYPKNVSELWLVSYFGLDTLARLLLDDGADVEAMSRGRETVLYRAAVNGHESTVQLLLERGANIESEIPKKGTALVGAARNGREGVVKLLLEKGASIEAKDTRGLTALHRVAKAGQVSGVRILLESGANINVECYDGMTALMWAAENTRTDVVRLLLEKGAKVNTKDNTGRAALHRAAESHRKELCVEVIRLLVENGHDLEIKTEDGHTSLHRAIDFGHEAAVEQLLKMGAKVDSLALETGAMRGDERLMSLLLANAANVTDADSASYISAARIARAVMPGNEASLQDYKAETVSVSSTLCEKLLLDAIRWHQEELAILLVDKIANFESKDMAGRTALFNAAEEGLLVLTKLLSERGADVQTRNITGSPVLHEIARAGNENAVKTILDIGASVDARDELGRTALQLAAWNGHKATVQLLLNRNADIHSRDKYGETALCRAAGGGHSAVVRLLLQEGADIETSCFDGMTALGYAAANGSKEVVRLLLDEGANPDNVNTQSLANEVLAEMIRTAQDLSRHNQTGENERRESTSEL